MHDPIDRGYAYKELVLEIKKQSPTYDIVITQKILGHMLFYWKVDPYQYQHMGSRRDEDGNWMGKYLFVPDPCPSNSQKYLDIGHGKKTLYIDKAECKVDEKDIIKTINWRHGFAAFYLVEPKSVPEK